MYRNILLLPDGREISSGPGTNTAIRSLTLTQLVNSGQELTLGSCCSHMLEATLITPGGALDITAGEAITLCREDPQGARTQLGIFTVEAPTRPTPNTLKLTGFDNVSRLDKDLTAWLEGLTGWPYGIQEFAELVCRACNLNYIYQPGLPNSGFPVEKWFMQEVTGRQIMGWLGQILCRFVQADENGCIRFGWYRESGKTYSPTGENYYFSLAYEDYTVAPIDTVQLRLGDGQSGMPWPPAQAGENAYILPRNPILEACLTEKRIHYLDTIHAQLQDLPDYTPCTLSVPGDSAAPVGSILRIRTAQGKTVTTCVMEKVTAGQKVTCRCTGSPRRSSTTAVNNRPVGQKNPGLTQAQIFNALTNQGQDQGLYLQDGKVYINAQYLLSGTFAAQGAVFLDPGFPEAQTIKNHLMGSPTIPETDLPKYDFNGDGEVTVTDMLIAQKCALGQQTLKDWPGAIPTPVTVTLDPANCEKVVSIRGINLWGREVEYYMGLAGTNLGRLLGDLTLEGKVLLGEATVADTLPATSQPGQLLLVKSPTDTPWAKCQCYVGV